jgi:hypothetical protein
VHVDRDLVEVWILRDADQLLGVDGAHDDVTGVRLVDDDVTREQGPQFRLFGEAFVGEWRVTRPENSVLVDVDIEFFLQGCFDVDVTEDPEAFVLQGSRDCGYDIVERCIDRCGDGVRHRSIECFWLPSSR